MKNKLLFVLLPLCLSTLPGCFQSKGYSLTLVNTDEDAATILCEGGMYKCGQQIKIELDVNQGYKVDRWVDDLGNKIGSREVFTYTMPSRDVTLTVSFEYESYELTIKDKVKADENHYDFTDWNSSQSYHNVNGKTLFGGGSTEFTWKDEVNVSFSYDFLSEYRTFSGWSDDTGTEWEENQIAFNMPNRDYEIYPTYTSKCQGLSVSMVNMNISGFATFNIHTYMNTNIKDEMIENIHIFSDDNAKSFSFTFNLENNYNVTFDYWLDLDTGARGERYQKTLTLENYSGFHHYQAVYHNN